MNYEDYDEELIGEAPCEFCGDLYPLYLLIEHQTTHLNEEQFFEEDYFPTAVVKETATTETTHLPEVNYSENDFQDLVVKAKAKIEPKKIEEEKQMLGSVNKQDEVPVQPSKTPIEISDRKSNVIKDSIVAQPLKAASSTIETKKNQLKSLHSQIEEFTTAKGEKLLVYGADIEPVDDFESEKQSYEKHNNPLLSTIRKEEDVIDISSLSDDDCEESLEEFWKRARDFLKRNKSKA